MPTRHIVKQGECLSLIARQYGFASYKRIYESPDNEAFRRRRPNPDVIFPGDELVIPEPQVKTLTLQTGQTHSFRFKSPKRKLRFRLSLPGGGSLAGQPYALEVGNKVLEGEVLDGNLVEQDVPVDAQRASLLLKRFNVRLALHVGALDPTHDEDSGEPVVTGVQARLNNLGYDCGEVDGRVGSRTTAALKRFQTEVMRMTDPTGTLDLETCRRLLEEHGC